MKKDWRGNLDKSVLKVTCKEFKNVKRYVNISVSFESTEKNPNIHVKPRIGSKTAAAFKPVLWNIRYYDIEVLPFILRLFFFTSFAEK